MWVVVAISALSIAHLEEVDHFMLVKGVSLGRIYDDHVDASLDEELRGILTEGFRKTVAGQAPEA